MNPRIEKKLSKRIVEMMAGLPREKNLVEGAWINKKMCWESVDSISGGKYSAVNNVYVLGGGVDCWGEGQDWATVYYCAKTNIPYIFATPIDQPDGVDFIPTYKGRLTGKKVIEIMLRYIADICIRKAITEIVNSKVAGRLLPS